MLICLPLAPPMDGKKREPGFITMLVESIGAATTHPYHPNLTDLYTDQFPDGVTIALPLKQFNIAWLSALEGVVDEEETGECELQILQDADESDISGPH